MRVVETKEVTEPRQFLIDILCNRCGGTCRSGYGDFEGLRASWTGGYGAKLGDMSSYEVDLCEDCCLVLFKDFTYDPQTSD